jgi:hypothetical protein
MVFAYILKFLNELFGAKTSLPLFVNSYRVLFFFFFFFVFKIIYFLDIKVKIILSILYFLDC